MANQEVDESKPSAVAEALSGPREYLHDTVGELRKVHWPTRLEARNLTTIVLATLLIMAIILGAMDYLFEQLMLSIITVNLVGIAILTVVAVAVLVLVLFASRNRNRY